MRPTRHLLQIFALLMIAGGLLLPPSLRVPPVSPVLAATPSSGTLSDATTELNWSGSTLTNIPVFNPSTCQTTQNCDVFTLHVSISDSYRMANPNFVVFVRVDWQNTVNDYDLFILKDGQVVDDSAQGFTTSEEVMLRQPANGTYQVFVHSFATVPGTPYSGKVTLLASPPTVAFRTATYQKDPDGKFGPEMFQFTSDLRLIGAREGQTGQNVEPDIEINPFGTIYISAIQGVPAGTDFWRSRDGGQTFQYLGQPDGAQSEEVARQRAQGIGGGTTTYRWGPPLSSWTSRVSARSKAPAG